MCTYHNSVSVLEYPCDRLAPNFDFMRTRKCSAALGFAWNSSKNYQFRNLCGVWVIVSEDILRFPIVSLMCTFQMLS